MAVIEAEGLFKGKRLRKCSATARLHWPYLYHLANGYARIELDYESIADEFISFRNAAPNSQEIMQMFAEFKANHLIFVYKVNDQEWGQWDTRHSLLKDYKTAADKATPGPPEAEYRSWLIEQHGSNWQQFHWDNDIPEETPDTASPKTLPNVDQDSPEVSKQIQPNPCGVGVGVGGGGGGGKKSKALVRSKNEPLQEKEQLSTPPTQPPKNANSFDGSEWALKTYKAYPSWKDPDAQTISPALGTLYMETVQRESPARGGDLAAAEWLLARVIQFGKMHQERGTEAKFIPGLKNFLTDSTYATVEMPGPKPPERKIDTGIGEPIEEFNARMRKLHDEKFAKREAERQRRRRGGE